MLSLSTGEISGCPRDVPRPNIHGNLRVPFPPPWRPHRRLSSFFGEQNFGSMTACYQYEPHGLHFRLLKP